MDLFKSRRSPLMLHLPRKVFIEKKNRHPIGADTCIRCPLAFHNLKRLHKGKDFFITSKSLPENYRTNTLLTLWTVLMLTSQSFAVSRMDLPFFTPFALASSRPLLRRYLILSRSISAKDEITAVIIFAIGSGCPSSLRVQRGRFCI